MNRRESYHVYPIHEQYRHILDGTICQYDPKVEHYEYRDLVIHNTAEEAKKKAN